MVLKTVKNALFFFSERVVNAEFTFNFHIIRALTVIHIRTLQQGILICMSV